MRKCIERRCKHILKFDLKVSLRLILWRVPDLVENTENSYTVYTLLIKIIFHVDTIELGILWCMFRIIAPIAIIIHPYVHAWTVIIYFLLSKMGLNMYNMFQCLYVVRTIKYMNITLIRTQRDNMWNLKLIKRIRPCQLVKKPLFVFFRMLILVLVLVLFCLIIFYSIARIF